MPTTDCATVTLPKKAITTAVPDPGFLAVTATALFLLPPQLFFFLLLFLLPPIFLLTWLSLLMLPLPQIFHMPIVATYHYHNTVSTTTMQLSLLLATTTANIVTTGTTTTGTTTTILATTFLDQCSRIRRSSMTIVLHHGFCCQHLPKPKLLLLVPPQLLSLC
jgi:hypothetical protein